MSTIAERAALAQQAKAQKIKDAAAQKIKDEEEMMNKFKLKTNTKKVRPSFKKEPSQTQFMKGAADEEAAKEAEEAANRRQALKDKTAAMLAKKKERMNEQAKLREHNDSLNKTAAELYGTDGSA